MALIWQILLGIFALIVIAGAIVLLTPICVSFDTNGGGERFQPAIRVWWGHPALLRVRYSAFDASYQLHVLGRFAFSGGQKTSAKGSDRSDAANGEREEVAAEPERRRAESDQTEPAKKETPEPPEPPKRDESLEHVETPIEVSQEPTSESARDRFIDQPDEIEPERRTLVDDHARIDQADAAAPPSEPPGPPEDAEPLEPPPGGDGAGDEGGKKKRKTGPFARIREWAQSSVPLFFFRQERLRKKLLQWILRVVRSLFGVVAFDRLYLRCRLGTGDPATTGKAAGYFFALKRSLVLPEKTGRGLYLEPVFESVAFNCAASVQLHTSPGMLLWPLVVALFTLPYATAILVLFRFWRWKKRRDANAAD